MRVYRDALSLGRVEKEGRLKRYMKEVCFGKRGIFEVYEGSMMWQGHVVLRRLAVRGTCK